MMMMMMAFISMINESQTYCRVTNTIYDNEITNMVKKWQGVKSCSMVLNVRKQKNGVVEVQRQNRGVHWTSVVISFQEKKTYLL